jgi:hypothetical protein
MDLNYYLAVMIIGSFIIQFLVMSIVMTNSISNITFSLGKFYISVIMALLMGLLEVFMHDTQMKTVSTIYYIGFMFLLVIFLYIYRNQVYIDDEEYLKEMIEHHSMAILTSEEILQKTKSERVKRLSENIISTQQKEIEFMIMMINNL